MPALLALVEAEDGLVDIVIGDVTGRQGASSGNLQVKRLCHTVEYSIRSTNAEEMRFLVCRVCELPYLGLLRQKAPAFLALVETKDGLVHVVVCDVTGS